MPKPVNSATIVVMTTIYDDAGNEVSVLLFCSDVDVGLLLSPHHGPKARTGHVLGVCDGDTVQSFSFFALEVCYEWV